VGHVSGARWCGGISSPLLYFFVIRFVSDNKHYIVVLALISVFTLGVFISIVKSRHSFTQALLNLGSSECGTAGDGAPILFFSPFKDQFYVKTDDGQHFFLGCFRNTQQVVGSKQYKKRK
jgi:hypothetical protein